jgi:hypothetical protein
MATGGKFDPDKLRELDLFGNDEPQEPDPIESASYRSIPSGYRPNGQRLKPRSRPRRSDY